MAVQAQSREWVSVGAVEAVSKALGEPAVQSAERLRALRAFRELPLEPNPLYRKYGYFAGVDLTGIDPSVRGAPVPIPPPPLGAVQVVHDASGTRFEIPPDLAALGVSVDTAPELWLAGRSTSGPAQKEPEGPSDRLSALAAATVNRGYRLTVPDGCVAHVRVQDVSVLSGPREALSVRRAIRIGDRSHALITEEVYATAGASNGDQRLYASSTDLEVGSGARAACLSVHAPDFRTVSVYQRHGSLGPSSRLAWIWMGFGGFRTKVRNRSFLPGEGSDLSDLQTFYGVGDQSYDSAIDITHIGTSTHGQSITRGVFRDQSRGMSRGLVRIEKEARKTISYISEHSMLLSKGARSDTIPILEILCRDVRATHSTSTAPVDPEKIFYLESRGVSEDDAVRLIGEGFLSHVLEKAPVAGLRELAYPFLAARWEGRPIVWAEGNYPALPGLELTGTETDPGWRFDAKLR